MSDIDPEERRQNREPDITERRQQAGNPPGQPAPGLLASMGWALWIVLGLLILIVIILAAMFHAG